MGKTRGSTVVMDDVLAGLTALGEAQESIARTMGVAMGEVVRDEARLRAPVMDPQNAGTDGQRPGALRDAIYLAYDDKRSGQFQQRYQYTVSWNRKKFGQGHLLEFGHWLPYLYAQTFPEGLFYTPKPEQPNPKGGNGFWVSARPFLGPAFDSKLPRLHSIAVQAGGARFKEIMG